MIHGAVILLYHRVITLDRDPQLLCVSPANFQAQINWLTSRFRVVPLSTIGEHLQTRTPMEDLVAITFDDGYFDNLQFAAPVLQAANCPATIFATTGLTNTNREFFWDDLDRIFLTPGRLPRPFASLDIDLGDSATYAGGFDRWTVLNCVNPTRRQGAYRRLTAQLHESSIAKRQEMLEQLQDWSNASPRATHRMMMTAELDCFSPLSRYARGGLGRGSAVGRGAREERRESGSSSSSLLSTDDSLTTPSLTLPRRTGRGGNDDLLITLGGHTVDHCRLSAESLDVQRTQIEENRAALGNPAAFSYPFGTRHDYTAETVEIVQNAGYSLACANFGGTVTLESDRYRLPRRIVRDWTLEQFIAEFERWTKPHESH